MGTISVSKQYQPTTSLALVSTSIVSKRFDRARIGALVREVFRVKCILLKLPIFRCGIFVEELT